MARSPSMPPAQLLAQLERARASTSLAPVLDAAGEMMAILNDQRQVVFANKALLDFAGTSSVEEVCGLRPGQALGCVNADATPEGCGEAEACGLCGVTEAFHETLRTGAPASRECRMTVGSGLHPSALDLLARAMPFQVDGHRFVVLALSDISHRRRRAALERIFFHDILNTVSSFSVYLDLLKASPMDDEALRLVGRLERIAAALVEEIRGQKILVSAENRTLSVQRDLIEARDLVERLFQQQEGRDAARGRILTVAPFSEAFTFVSDDSLVMRVLGNMLTNALEASPPGEAVTISFRPDTDGRVRFEVHNAAVIPAHIAAQIFQRSFSTKGGDRGLGTWSMKLLSEEYLGGSVSFTSRPGEGTTFSLLIPRMPAPPDRS